MMTWNSMFFNQPNSNLLSSVVSMYDYVSILLALILGAVLCIFSFFPLIKAFDNYFFQSEELEIIWTLIPFILLTFVIFPSLLTLYQLDSCLFCGINVSIVGHQWYWSYLYQRELLEFDSYMLPSEATNLRLLDVDNRLTLPSHTPIRVLVCSSDVIHSWTVPSLGVKLDAIPGRLNQFCFTMQRCGVFFGQCSEICGANHSFMPIVLESIEYWDY